MNIGEITVQRFKEDDFDSSLQEPLGPYLNFVDKEIEAEVREKIKLADKHGMTVKIDPTINGGFLVTISS